jgi:hypothetical protein
MAGSAEGEQQDEVRGSRETGGDAEAAGSVDEREAMARGEDPLFGDGDGEGGGDGEGER